MTGRASVLIFTVIIVVAAGTTGCSNLQKKEPTFDISQITLEDYAASVLTEDELQKFSVPFSINREMADLAKTVVDAQYDKTQQAKKLALLLLEENSLGINYSRNSNFTAKEVFSTRQANCISYTNLFIGMARSIGINAYYADVTEVDSYDKVGKTVVYNSHICAVVYNGPKTYLIDFSLRRYPQYHSWRAITDREAAADFYNNIGSGKFITDSDAESLKNAEMYFSIALKIFPDSPPVYNNLGVLKLRQNDLTGAEEMFNKALQLRPGYFAAYANLANVYRNKGDTDKAIELLTESTRASSGNPYTFLSLGKLLVEKHDLYEAEKVLRQALRIDKFFTEARHELGRLYLRMGRSKEAMEQFALALKYQPNDDLARNKMALIEKLASKNGW